MHGNVAWRDPTRRVLDRVLRSRFIAALVAPAGVDGYAQLFEPTWAKQEVRARVVAVVPETRRAVSLWLRPNRNWGGFVPGQFVLLSVPIDGVRHTRAFSLSAPPAEGRLLRVTIQSLPGGRLSGWAQHARAGEVVGLSQAMGEFVLPEPLPQRVLMISAGSGITPLMALTEQLLASRHEGDITFLHYARDEVIFAERLKTLARRHPNFRLIPCVASSVEASGAKLRFDQRQLEHVLQDWAQCETFLCGPRSLEHTARELFRRYDVSQRLHVERFSLRSARPSGAALGLTNRCRLDFARSDVQFQGGSGASLLEQAEQAGLRPAHGCRIGICHRCKCKKLSGSVRNLLTEQVSSDAEETIQLCIHAPVSDVVLDL